MVIATRSTAIGAFASRADAEQAVCGLLEAAFGPDDVGIVLPGDVAPAAESEESRPIASWNGAIFRTLIGVEIPEDEVHYYEEALQEGRTLVMVRARDRFSEAMDILHQCGGKYMAAF
jgi:hypothetical protein